MIVLCFLHRGRTLLAFLASNLCRLQEVFCSEGMARSFGKENCMRSILGNPTNIV